MKSSIFLSFIFSTIILHSQVAMGDWRMHIAPKAIEIAAGDNLIFAALETGLLEYDILENETTLWTDVNSLSDIYISTIYFDSYSNSFFVGYQNGNIDRITDKKVTNIPAIKLAQFGGDKSVLSFTSTADYIYANTGFGIVLINPKNNEIKDTYYPTNGLEKIKNIVLTTDSIFALTPSKIYKAKSSNIALADPNQWLVDARAPVISVDEYQDLFAFKEELYLIRKNPAYAKDSVFRLGESGLVNVVDLGYDLEIQSIRVSEGEILLTLSDVVYQLDDNFQLVNYIPSTSSLAMNAKSALNFESKIFISDNKFGIVEYSENGLRKIENIGPPKNNFFALGGSKSTVTVAGGLLKKLEFEYSPAGAYVFKDEEWTLFDHGNQTAWQGQNLWDVSSIAVHPTDNNKYAIASFSEIPLSIVEDGKTISNTYLVSNSLLENHNSSPSNVCISDIKYDSRGNLWMVNCFSFKPLKVLTKDNVWYDFEAGSNIKNKFSGKLVIDNNGNKWFSVSDLGIIGYNDGGTISDPSDDKYVNINNGANSGALPEQNVTALAVDLDNEIWIGTTEGFAILYNSSGAFTAEAGAYNAQRIKIDFEGNVEFLLGNTSITDIEVDGGNRKWMGTANAGIFLLSADGQEVLQNFTKENSPLISNSIVDMQFNSTTGELFIITDNGLVSLRTNSSLGDPTYEDVKVFPNPVKPDFNGVITIQGIKADSDIKFTDAAGNLVFQTTSNGGTATWNGKNLSGNKVSPGVYLIWTASNTEKGRKVGKVVILN
jgi:hypothetical protein